MPDADKFMALGRGNGFPFCLTNASEETIAARQVFPPNHAAAGRQRRLRKNFDSLADAMDLFWNTYDFTIEISTSLGAGYGTQKSLLKARLDKVDDWYEEYGFYPEAGNNPSITPHYRVGFIGEDTLTGEWTEQLLPEWRICGGEVTEGSDGGYTLTNGDPYGDEMEEATGEYDAPDQNGTFFSPEWYYNTTTEKYCIVFDCSIREVINFDGYTQSYELKSSNINSTYEETTMEMFDEQYSLYTDEYLVAGPPDYDTEMQSGGTVIVTANKFTYL